MKQLIMGLAGIALIASATVATAKPAHHNGFVSRNVGLSTQPRAAAPANADLRYGPQVDYPQSPAGGGY